MRLEVPLLYRSVLVMLGGSCCFVLFFHMKLRFVLSTFVKNCLGNVGVCFRGQNSGSYVCRAFG